MLTAISCHDVSGGGVEDIFNFCNDSHFSNFPNAFQSSGIWVQVYCVSAFKPHSTNSVCIVHGKFRDICVNAMLHVK